MESDLRVAEAAAQTAEDAHDEAMKRGAARARATQPRAVEVERAQALAEKERAAAAEAVALAKAAASWTPPPAHAVTIELEFQDDDSGPHTTYQSDSYPIYAQRVAEAVAPLGSLFRCNAGPRGFDPLYVSTGGGGESKNIMFVDAQGGRMRYPRPGAFEISAVLPPAAGGRSVVLFSKLSTKRWPDASGLVDRLRALLQAVEAAPRADGAADLSEPELERICAEVRAAHFARAAGLRFGPSPFPQLQPVERASVASPPRGTSPLRSPLRARARPQSARATPRRPGHSQ